MPLSYRFLFVLALFVFPLLISPTAYAASTCIDTYTSGSMVPTGYGAAYNLFSSAKEMLVKTASCTDTSVAIKVGNDDSNTYVYKEGWSWNGTSWDKMTFTGVGDIMGNQWYLKSATGNFSIPTGNTSKYYVGYTCQKIGDVWKCGCRDTTCATPAWQLQRVTKTTTTDPVGPVCGNGVCETGETTSSCSQDCKPVGDANLIINYGSAASPGTLNRLALGYLHGLSTSLSGTSISPASLWTSIAPTIYRSNPGGVTGAYAESKRLGASLDTTWVATLSGSWGYPGQGKTQPPWITASNPNSSYTNPDYSDWLNNVVAKVNNLKKSGISTDKRIYDLWNEPNGSEYWGAWDSREAANGYPRLKELYRLTYKLLKEGLPGYNGGVALDPNVRFTAPGTAVGLNNLNETFTTDFMKYTKDNNVVPDLWNWHFGDPKTLDRFNIYMNYAASLGISRDALVLEYLREQDGKRPGRAIYELALLESATNAGSGKKIIGATQAHWPTTDEAGNSLFYSGGAWRKHGDWYMYANYAKMQGKEAPFTYGVGTTKFGAVASIDATSKKAWALLGNDVFDQRYSPSDTATITTTTVRLDGIQSGDASGKVNVTVSRIPYKNFGEVTDTDIIKVIDNAVYTVTNNSISVAIPWGLAIDGYFMEVNNVIPQ